MHLYTNEFNKKHTQIPFYTNSLPKKLTEHFEWYRINTVYSQVMFDN